MAVNAPAFDVGDYVVYPKHGVGRVVELQSEEIAGMKLELVRLPGRTPVLFLGDYLTVEGQTAEADLDMIVEGGFEIVGAEESAAELRDRVRAHRTSHREALNGGQPASNGSQEESVTGSLPCGKPQPVGVGASAGVTIPVIRRRGAGTAEVPNA